MQIETLKQILAETKEHFATHESQMVSHVRLESVSKLDEQKKQHLTTFEQLREEKGLEMEHLREEKGAEIFALQREVKRLNSDLEGERDQHNSSEKLFKMKMETKEEDTEELKGLFKLKMETKDDDIEELKGNFKLVRVCDGTSAISLEAVDTRLRSH